METRKQLIKDSLPVFSNILSKDFLASGDEIVGQRISSFVIFSNVKPSVKAPSIGSMIKFNFGSTPLLLT
jgi:hypothetical protein